MYHCLLDHIKRFSIENNLNLLFQVDVKPVYIDDAFGGVMVDRGRLNAVSFYNLLQNRITSVRLYRKPVVGILHGNPNLGKTLSLVGSELGIFAIDLGLIRSKEDLDRGCRLSDVLMVTSSSPEKVEGEELGGITSLPWIRFTNAYVSRLRNCLAVIVEDEDIVSNMGVILYFVRLYLHYFFKEHILFYPIDYLDGGKEGFEVYAVDSSLNILGNPEDLLGYKIICRNGVFLEKITI